MTYFKVTNYLFIPPLMKCLLNNGIFQDFPDSEAKRGDDSVFALNILLCQKSKSEIQKYEQRTNMIQGLIRAESKDLN